MIPETISINMDLPFDLKVRGVVNGMLMLYLINFEYKVTAAYNIVESMDGGDNTYTYMNVHPIQEISGGLAHFDYGWKIFPQDIQEKYADYIAEQEILDGQENG